MFFIAICLSSGKAHAGHLSAPHELQHWKKFWNAPPPLAGEVEAQALARSTIPPHLEETKAQQMGTISSNQMR